MAHRYPPTHLFFILSLAKSSQTVIFVQTQLPGNFATEADVYVGGGTRHGLCFY